MQTILQYLRHHLRHHVSWRVHAVLAVLLVGAFWFNYATDFKREVMNAHAGSWREIPRYVLFYAIPFGGALLVQWRLTGSRLPNEPRFWWAVALALVVLALNRTVIAHTPGLVRSVEWPVEVAWFAQKCLVNVTRTAALLVPLLLLRRIWGENGSGLFGLAWRRFDWRPYAAMLAMMAVPIVWASFQPAFLRTYPIYRPGVLEAATGWPSTMTYGIHEICYALRFVGVELFFRGFLVIGLVRWLGRDTLLPMVCLYAFWHFGKPFPEALGSVFGGYVLGIIALESRCILGGTAIHVGIALLMNFAALLHTVPR